MSRRVALLAAIAAATLDAVAIAVFWQVREAREAIGASLRTGQEVFYGYARWASFTAEAKALQIGGGALLLFALVVALAGIGWARRRSARPLATLAVVVPAAIGGLVGAALLGGARAFLGYHEGCGDPAVIHALRFEAFSSHAVPLHVARIAILVVALLSTATVVAIARRRSSGRHASSLVPRLAAPAVLFIAGVVAFGATRADASDARRPMPVVTGVRLGLEASVAATMPPALGCEPWIDEGPTLVLARGAWSLDGLPTADAAELGRLVAVRRELWKVVQPERPFPGILLAAIPADTPLGIVRPMLAAARAAGYPQVTVLEVMAVEPWSSRTLGDVPYLPRVCQARLAAGEEPLAGTWGGLAIALARRR